MKNYKTILKLLIKDMFKKKEKKQTIVFALLGVLYLIMAAFAVLMVYIYSPILLQAGKSVEFIVFLLFIDFLLTIFFGTIAAINFLFISKDSEFFKALPVKQSSVFMAKLTVVYLTEAVLSAVILIPTLIFAGIFLSFSPLFFCLIPVFALSVPIFSLMFIAIISLPFMYIISLFKNRGAVSSIALILVFVVGFSVYMYFAMSWNSQIPEDGQINYDGTINTVTVIANVFYPMYMLVAFAAITTVFSLNLAAGMALEILIFLVSLLAMFVVSYFLCALVYNKTTGKLLENRARSGAAKSHAVSSTIKALIKVEWRGIIRNPGVAMQVVSGVILCPVIVFVFCLSISNLGTTLSSTDMGVSFDSSPIIWIMGIMSIMMFGVGVNSGSVTCISREGRCINYLKTLPIQPKTIIKAKTATYMLISGLSILTGVLAMVALMIINDAFIWWIPAGGLIMALVWLYAMTNVSIYFDLRNPKLDWKNFREVIKRGKNNVLAIVWMLLSMILCVVFIVLVFAGLLLDAEFIIALAFIIMTTLGGVAAFIFKKMLDNNADEYFKRLQI